MEKYLAPWGRKFEICGTSAKICDALEQKGWLSPGIMVFFIPLLRQLSVGSISGRNFKLMFAAGYLEKVLLPNLEIVISNQPLVWKKVNTDLSRVGSDGLKARTGLTGQLAVYRDVSLRHSYVYLHRVNKWLEENVLDTIR